MQHIKIYDKHEDWQEDGVTSNCMILGVHSFAHYLSECANKKNLKIFIKGKIQQVIQNVLWNQYYSYTLLKDIDKIIFAGAQKKNIFFKIEGKTYRLSQCFQWTGHKKIQTQILKCPSFFIEGFMSDSSIKFTSIDIGQYRNGQYDIVFEYNHQMNQTSFSLNWTNANRSQNNYSCLTNHNNKKKQEKNQNIAVKSLFQSHQPRQRKQNYSIKYSTQKKNKQVRPSINKNQVYKPKQPVKKNYHNTLSKKSNKQSETFSQKNLQSNHKTQKTERQTLSHIQKISKQQTAANILHKKQQKIKQYRKLLQQKQKDFDQKLTKIQQAHEQQVESIKNQVKDVLSCYKKKNKALKKQNTCLTQMNDKLVIANKKLEQTVEKMNQTIQTLKQGQQKLQKNNLEYCLKLQNIQNANTTLMQKINRQQANYQSQIVQKQKMNSQIKLKYDRLLGNIKYATAQVDKQNFH